MNKKFIGNKEPKVNISLFKPEPNASIWGCITGKSKWSDFLKPQIDGQTYKVDLNLQTLGKNERLSKIRRKQICMKQVVDSQGKKLIYNKTVKKNSKSSTNIYVKHLISNSTFPTNISHKMSKIPKFTRQDGNNMSLPVYKLKSQKSEHPTTTQLKFKDNVIHLYNVKGMKHKKVILRGLPVNNMLPSLMKNRKHAGSRTIYLNPTISKSKLVSCNENRCVLPNVNKYKKESPSRIKSAEQQIVIPQLLSKIQSMEQQIHLLEDTTKKMDKEVNSTKSLCLEQSKQAVQQLPANRKSIVMVSYRRSKLLTPKKTSGLQRKKFNKTGMKMKNKSSKLETPKTIRDYYGLSLDKSTESFDLLAKNLKMLIKNKVKEKMFSSDTQEKFKSIDNNECNICNQEKTANKNYPQLLEIELNSNKGDFNYKADKNEISGTENDLGADNIMINSEQNPQLNTYSHFDEGYNSLHSPERNFINIMRTSLELENMNGKSQQLPTENKVDGLFLEQNELLNHSSQHTTPDSTLDFNDNDIMSNENIEPVQSSNSYKTKFQSENCERKSVSILNTKTHNMIPVKGTDINQQQENCEGLNKTDTKFNITIFINEKDDTSNKTNVFGQYENLQLIESHLKPVKMTSHKVTEVHEAQIVKADATGRNFYKCTPIKEKNLGLNACYKPVSCPGELNKFKMKFQPGKNFVINNDRVYDHTNSLQPKAKSDNQIQEPVNKPYLSRKQRKDMQKRNEMNLQTRFKFNDSLNKCDNSNNVKKEKNQGNTYPILKTFEKDITKYGINTSNKLYSTSHKEPKNNSKTNLNLDHVKICNNTNYKDYRFGDTERRLGTILDGFQTYNKEITDTNKPFSFYNEMNIKKLTQQRGDQNSYYCDENMFYNNFYLRCPKNYLPEMYINGLKNNTNINNAKFITENFNYENDLNFDKYKKNVNFTVKDLKTESRFHQLTNHAEKNFINRKENKCSSDNRCNIERFSSIVGSHSEVEQTLQRTSVINNNKTMFDYTISKSSALEKNNQSAVDKNNKKTYRIKLSTLVNKKRTKRKNDSDSNEYTEDALDLNHCIECKNLSQISLPVKKCGGLLKINDEDGNDLKKYFSRLSNTIILEDKSIGMDSRRLSSKNKNDEMISEIVTCIREMTINQVVDKESSKGCNIKPFTGSENIEQKIQNENEMSLTENTNISSGKQTTVPQLIVNNYQNNMDLELSKEENNKRKCECCIHCQKKAGESSKDINSENGNCAIKELHEECLPLLKNQNKLDSEISNNKHPPRNNFYSGLKIPILKSPSDFELKEKRTVQQNYQKIPNQFLKYHDFPCSKQNLLKPIIISCYNFSDEKTTTEKNSPTPLKGNNVEDKCYSLQFRNDSSIPTDNFGVSCDKTYSLNAIVTSLSSSILAPKYCTNIFGAFEENNSSEIINSNYNLKKCAVQKKMSNQSFEKLKSKFIENNRDVEQSILINSFANKCSSSSSVVKSNKIKDNCDVRQCHSESDMCFPNISTDSSSNSTVSSNEQKYENKIGIISSKTKHFLQEFQQKIELMKVSSKQSRGQCQIMMEIYNNACEFQKISNEWMNLFNKLNETVHDSDNINTTNKETNE